MQLLKLFVNDCSRIFAAHHHGADNAEFCSSNFYVRRHSVKTTGCKDFHQIAACGVWTSYLA